MRPRRRRDYPKPIVEVVTVKVEKTVGWIHLCAYCGEEFRAKKRLGPKYCPTPKLCRLHASRERQKKT